MNILDFLSDEILGSLSLFVKTATNWMDNYFRPLLICIGAAISIYLATQKFGSKIQFSHGVSISRNSHQRISKMVLTNCKDKTIAVWSITQIIDDHYLELKTFDEPLIIKPYESAAVSFEEISEIGDVNGKKYEAKWDASEFKIIARLDDRYIECKPKKRKNKNPLQSLKAITAHTYKFNDFVYNKNVKYFLAYIQNGKSFTAFIEHSGFITNEWGMKPNMLHPAQNNPTSIQHILVDQGLHDIFTDYVCYDAEDSNKAIFTKKSNQFSN